jgi:hypothetical protein
LFRRLLLVSSNVSTECCVVNVPDVHEDESAEDFVVEEPDDEKNFTMVDAGAPSRSFSNFLGIVLYTAVNLS